MRRQHTARASGKRGMKKKNESLPRTALKLLFSTNDDQINGKKEYTIYMVTNGRECEILFLLIDRPLLLC